MYASALFAKSTTGSIIIHNQSSFICSISLLSFLPESLLSGASVLTPTPLGPDTPLMARFCTWWWRHRTYVWVKTAICHFVAGERKNVSSSHENIFMLATHLVVIRLAAGRGSRRHFLLLLLSLWLLGNSCHSSSCSAAGHENELGGDRCPKGAVYLQDKKPLKPVKCTKLSCRT